jgi:hypothetical protein
MPRYTWSHKNTKSRKKLISKKTVKKQKGGEVSAIPVFVSPDKMKSLLNVDVELTITGIITDGNGTKPAANYILKMIRLDTNTLTNFDTCISIFRNIMEQLICSSPIVQKIPDEVKNNDNYTKLWVYIQPSDKSANKNDKLPSAIKDYNSLIQFIKTMRDFLIDPSNSKKMGRFLGSSSISDELVNYITETLRPAVFSICGVKPTSQPSTSSGKGSSGTAPSGTAPNGTAPSGTAPSGTAPSGLRNIIPNMPQGTIGAMPIDLNNIQSIEGQLKELGMDKVTPKMLKLAKRIFWLGKRFLPKETAEDIKQMIEHFSKEPNLTTENIRDALSKAGYAEPLPEYEINEIKAIHDTPEYEITEENVAAEVLPELPNKVSSTPETEEPATEPDQHGISLVEQEKPVSEPSIEPSTEPSTEPSISPVEQGEPVNEPETSTQGKPEAQPAPPEETAAPGPNQEGGARLKNKTYRVKTQKIIKHKKRMPSTTLKHRAVKLIKKQKH